MVWAQIRSTLALLSVVAGRTLALRRRSVVKIVLARRVLGRTRLSVTELVSLLHWRVVLLLCIDISNLLVVDDHLRQVLQLVHV